MLSRSENVVGRYLTAAYSEETLEIVTAGIAMLLAQNYIVTNPFFDESEIKKYLQLRKTFHADFVKACLDLADAFEEGRFGPAVKPAIRPLRAIGALNVRQEQQALRQLALAFRGLRNLSYRDIDDPKLFRVIYIARNLDSTEGRDVKEFLETIVQVKTIPPKLRTLFRKVIKLPTPNAPLSETANPGAWFEMPADKKKNLRELADKLEAEQDQVWEKHKDSDPEERLEAYKDVTRRLQKVQNIAGANLNIIRRKDEVPLEKVLRSEAKLDSDGPTEFTRLKIEEYINKVGRWEGIDKTRKTLPRETKKLLTSIRKAKTFPTMQRIIKEAVERKIVGREMVQDIDTIIDQASKNKAVREGKPLVPLQYEPVTEEEFQVKHDTGDIEFDHDYTEEERKEILGRVSRAVTDLEAVFGKGFCGKHNRKLAFRFNKFSGGMTRAHYFVWDNKSEWQPRVTFGDDYEGLLAHELSHYLEDLLAYRIQKQVDPEQAKKREELGIKGGPGDLFGLTGVPLSRLGEGEALAYRRDYLHESEFPELVEFIDAVLATPDYKRWEDKLGSPYDLAMPKAIKSLTGKEYFDLPKDHPYYNAMYEAAYRSELPPELNEEVQKQYKNMMGGDDRRLTYYHSTAEVWARMCEQYVYNKLIDAGISNPWLTQMSYDADTYVEEERFDTEIRPVMDRLFARLKGRTLIAAQIVQRYLTAKYKEKKQVPSQDGGKTTVYVYSERQVADRNRKKAERIQKLGQAIKKLRSKVKKDLRSSDPEIARTALAVALMDHTYERVGNDLSAKDGHFGVTGWKRKHVSFQPDAAFIKYVGKSGVKQEKKITDKSIRKALRDAYDAMKDNGAGLLQWDSGRVTPEKVNAYLKPFGITAKDIRGFHANHEMRERLKKVRTGQLPTDRKERQTQLKAEFKEALEDTAKAVGHEASTLKSQYLVPGLESSYLKDGTIIDKFHVKR